MKSHGEEFHSSYLHSVKKCLLPFVSNQPSPNLILSSCTRRDRKQACPVSPLRITCGYIDYCNIPFPITFFPGWRLLCLAAPHMEAALYFRSYLPLFSELFPVFIAVFLKPEILWDSLTRDLVEGHQGIQTEFIYASLMSKTSHTPLENSNSLPCMCVNPSLYQKLSQLFSNIYFP